MIVEARRKALGALSAQHELGSVLQGVGDVLVHLRGHAFVVEWPQRGVVRERIAQPERARRVRQAGHELVADRLLDQDPLAGGAALARAQVAAHDCAFHGASDVGVCEDDLGAVAAELEHHVLARGPPRHRRPGFGRADETDSVHQRVACHLVADLGSGAGDQVDRAGRKVGFDDAFHQRHRDHAGRGGRRPDHRVAGREGGRDQLRGHRQRPVPGRDDAVDPTRVVLGQDELARAGRGQHAAFQAFQVLGGDAEVLDRLLDLADGLGLQRLALVEREQVGQLVPPSRDGVGDPVQPHGTFEAFEAGHRRASLVGGLDRALGVGAGALGDLGDDLAGRRAVGVKELAALGLDPPAFNEHLPD